MKIIRPRVFLALSALLVLWGPAISQPATISWPEAVAQLAGQRANAETCVSLVKKYGNDAQIARGQHRRDDAIGTAGHRPQRVGSWQRANHSSYRTEVMPRSLASSSAA